MIFRTRKLVKHEDLNPAGTLFGGRALEWIDEEAAIYSLCQLKFPTHLVTKMMSTIDFKAPAKLGDIVEIGMDTVKIGTTSITVACTLRNKRTGENILHVDKIVFVNLGPDGKPAPHEHAWVQPYDDAVYYTDGFGKTVVSRNGLQDFLVE